MNYRKDKYGNDLSILGFGCMRFQRRQGRIDYAEAERELLEAFRGGVEFSYDHTIPAPYNNPELTDKCAAYLKELLGEDMVVLTDKAMGAGDDFARVTDCVPGALLNLGFGTKAEGYTCPGHNPKVIYNEEALPIGAAIDAYLAMRWLEDQAENRISD